MIVGIGKNIDDRSPHCVLPRRGNEIHLLEAFFRQFLFQALVIDFISLFNIQYGRLYLIQRGYLFFQGLRISDEDGKFLFPVHQAGQGGSTLYAEGRFIITPFYILSGRRKIEYIVPAEQGVEVGAGIFRSFPVRHQDQMGTLAGDLTENKPAGG